jgi:basic membrane protein A
MKKIIALFAVALMVLSLAACASTTTEEPAAEAAVTEETVVEEAATEETTEEVTAPAVKIGVILVHDENTGYDAAHIEGIKAAAANVGIADEDIIWKYNISEDENCYDTAIDLVEQGCSYIFSDSYGHQSYMQQAADENPTVVFVSMTGDTAALSGLDNFKNAFTHTFESRYVSGVVAGMKLKEMLDAGLVTDPYIGYVGAYPYAEVVSGYTAFFLGIQSIVPDAHMDVIYTNSWYDPTAEAEAANSLMSKGCCIISQHADSTGAPSAVQTALDAGSAVYCVGYNIDMLSVAPTAALTSAQNNWGVYYTYAFNCALTGADILTDWSEGYATGANMISALGESCAEGTAEKVAEVEAAIIDGSLNIFDCSTFTVGGETVTTYLAIDTDGDWVGDTGEAITDGIFYESTLRSAPYFGLRIDGITELS